MTIDSFAADRRLRIRQDDCGDKIIPGKRGHLYVDDGRLCLMVTDGAPANRSRWEALGGKLWMGDISPHPKTGRRVQDVKIAGIPVENAKAAIRMIRAFPKRVLSPEELAMRQALVRKNFPASTRRPSPAPESNEPGLDDG